MSETNKTAIAAPMEFFHELAACWQALPDKPIFFSLLAAWLALFQFLGNSTFGYVDTASLFTWLYTAYNAPLSEDGHGNLIPFAVFALLWWRRATLLAVPRGLWLPALGWLALALALHVAGYVVQQPRLSVIAFFLGVYALTGLVWGRAWLRASGFPFVLFAFCVPLGSLAESITFPLRLLVAKISVGLSGGLLGMDVMQDGTRIFNSTRTFNYDVAPACSGIRSLISLLALTTIYGFMTFEKPWKRLVMVAVALPLAVLGNLVRLLGIILVADAFGHEAGAFVEQKFGFVTFAVALGGVLLLGYWLRESRTLPPPEEAGPA